MVTLSRLKISKFWDDGKVGCVCACVLYFLGVRDG